MSREDAPGWYGKLATQGDFASRRLPQDWVQACDQWLAQCVTASRQQLGGRWLEVYLNAPVWRFAWGPGVVDQQWWFGVLMPSCDNVGRYFPLVVVQARPQAPSDRFGLDHLDLWWEHVARASLSTLTEGATLEAFEDALHGAPPWPGAGPYPPVTLPPAAAGRWRQNAAAGASLGEMALAMAAGDLQHRLVRASFWWPLWAGGGPGSYTVLPGLPPAESFGQMLEGSW